MQDKYAVSSSYTGPRVFQVPVRMYSRNSLFGAMGIKSKRYLSVDLDRNMFTFHKSRDPKDNKDKDHEIAFNKLTNVETDVSKASAHKYYMTVNTAEGDLKFKFKNAQDFHQVGDALANVTQSGKALHKTSDQYKKFNNDYSTNKATNIAPGTTGTTGTTGQTTTTGYNATTRSRSASSVSSDSDKEYKYEDESRDKVKKANKDSKEWTEEERKDKEKNAKDAQKDYQNIAEKDIKDSKKDAKDWNKDQEKAAKHDIDNKEKYGKDQQKLNENQFKDANKSAEKNIEYHADRSRENVDQTANYNDKQIDQNTQAAKDANKY